jgi:hypothetical protein
MDQSKLEEMMEFLKAIEHKREADKAEMMARMEAKLDSGQERTNANLEEMKATIRCGQEEMNKAIMGASRESTEACEGKTKALLETMEACPEVTPACLEEEKEQAPEETEAMEKSWEVSKGGVDEEKFGATEDRAGELRLAVRHFRQRKKRAQENGGPRQKFAAFRGQFTRRAIPALLKGHVRKGSRRNRYSGVRGPGKTFRSRMEVRSLKQRQIKGNVARETPEGWMDEKRRRTHLECNSGIQRLSKTSGNRSGGRTEKLDQRLEAKRKHREVTRQNLHLEIARLIVRSFIGLREPGDRTMWKCRPPPKQKRNNIAAPQGAAAVRETESQESD